jgi:hypothetical protein
MRNFDRHGLLPRNLSRLHYRCSEPPAGAFSVSCLFAGAATKLYVVLSGYTTALGALSMPWVRLVETSNQEEELCRSVCIQTPATDLPRSLAVSPNLLRSQFASLSICFALNLLRSQFASLSFYCCCLALSRFEPAPSQSDSILAICYSRILSLKSVV